MKGIVKNVMSYLRKDRLMFDINNNNNKDLSKLTDKEFVKYLLETDDVFIVGEGEALTTKNVIEEMDNG